MEFSKTGNNEFDFDEWLKLADSDPERFEQLRSQLVNATIDQAPAHMRRRLHGLQFQIDMIRHRTRHPLGTCIKLSNMMWDVLFPLPTPATTSDQSDQAKGGVSLEAPAVVITFPTTPVNR